MRRQPDPLGERAPRRWTSRRRPNKSAPRRTRRRTTIGPSLSGGDGEEVSARSPLVIPWSVARAGRARQLDQTVLADLRTRASPPNRDWLAEIMSASRTSSMEWIWIPSKQFMATTNGSSRCSN